MPPPLTTKAAKAACKSRATTTTLSEREKKQLERAVLLERRAWGLREREKQRAEAVKKRSEKERFERGGLGTQRRHDRFGFKGSQMHLGVWFGGGRVVEEGGTKAGVEMETAVVGAEGGMGNGGGVQELEVWDEVDDESLLEALKTPDQTSAAGPISKMRNGPCALECTPTRHPPDQELVKLCVGQENMTDRPASVPPCHPLPRAFSEKRPSAAPASSASTQDNEWDDELLLDYVATQYPPKHHSNPDEPFTTAPQDSESQLMSADSSFGSLDLTDQEIDRLESCTVKATNQPKPTIQRTRHADMPLPPPPLERDVCPAPQRDRRSQTSGTRTLGVPKQQVPAHAGSVITLTQLEGFDFEDDLQLTQVDPI